MTEAGPQIAMLALDENRCPVTEWLDSIRDVTTRARITRQIDKLSRGLGAQKKLKNIAELKMDIGPGYRVYYAYADPKTLIVLIGGGDKSSQRKDILEARRLWESFVRGGSLPAALRVWQETHPGGAEKEQP